MHPHRASRVCRSRRRGTPLPEGTIYVGRPTLWGNPFMGRRWGHAKSIVLHRRWLFGQLGALSLERMGFSLGEVEALDRLRQRVFANLHRLQGMNLACWCPMNSQWCHAETLLDLAAHHQRYEAA